MVFPPHEMVTITSAEDKLAHIERMDLRTASVVPAAISRRIIDARFRCATPRLRSRFYAFSGMKVEDPNLTPEDARSAMLLFRKVVAAAKSYNAAVDALSPDERHVWTNPADRPGIAVCSVCGIVERMDDMSAKNVRCKRR
jgi:hypothetical protein